MMLRKAARVFLREARLPLARWAARRRLPVPAPPEPGTVAIVRPDLTGDFILASSALGAIREAFEGRQLTLFGHPSWIPLAEWLQRWGVIDGVRAFANEFAPLAQEDLVKPAAMFDAALQLARHETIVYFAASRTNSVDALLSLPPGRKLAWRGGLGNMLPSRERTNRSLYDTLYDVPDAMMPEYVRNARMVKMLDKRAALPEHPPVWHVPAEAAEESLAEFKPGLDAPYIAISPFTSVPLKDWPLDQYANLLRRLAHAFPGHRLVILGAASNPALSSLANELPRAVDLSGATTLPQACCLIAGADLSISGDTAPAHIASAVGTPALAVMGGGHYGRFFPYPAAHDHCENVALTHEMPCFQCNWACRYRWFRETPAPCVANVSVDRVFDAASRLLQSSGR